FTRLTPSTWFSTRSLHDALPISRVPVVAHQHRPRQQDPPRSAGRVGVHVHVRTVEGHTVVDTATTGLAHAVSGQHPPSGLSGGRSEEHTSELQSRFDLVCRLLLE